MRTEKEQLSEKEFSSHFTEFNPKYMIIVKSKVQSQSINEGQLIKRTLLKTILKPANSIGHLNAIR